MVNGWGAHLFFSFLHVSTFRPVTCPCKIIYYGKLFFISMSVGNDCFGSMAVGG